jgi:hypothetical protein
MIREFTVMIAQSARIGRKALYFTLLCLLVHGNLLAAVDSLYAYTTDAPDGTDVSQLIQSNDDSFIYQLSYQNPYNNNASSFVDAFVRITDARSRRIMAEKTYVFYNPVQRYTPRR